MSSLFSLSLEVYSEPSQTSKMELFMKIGKYLQQLKIFAKGFIRMHLRRLHNIFVNYYKVTRNIVWIQIYVPLGVRNEVVK